MKTTGIDAISFYVPSIYVDMEDLAEARNIAFAKLNKGLGLNKMAFADANEDAASFAANALFKLITENDINPKSVGRIYLGTESALDASKPTCTYAVEVVEQELSEKFGERCFKNCDVVDMTFACVGAVDALQNCIDWVNGGSNRNAIVIASDLAKYELNSGGEYTQGAGSVAFLIKENPSIISFSSSWGVASKSVGDFFKPRRHYDKSEMLKAAADLLGSEISSKQSKKIIDRTTSDFWSNSNKSFELFKEEPIFDGPYSNLCYQERIDEALEHFKFQQHTNFLIDWQFLVFHLPYAFQGRRMITKNWVEWLKENQALNLLTDEIGDFNEEDSSNWYKKASKSSLYRTFVEQRIAPGEKASSEIGNMYTASIFMSLLSLLNYAFESKIEIAGNKVGFLSYGSGSKSKVFQGSIESSWKKKLINSNLFSTLNNRTKISITTYESLHKNEAGKPVISDNYIKLSNIENGPLNLGLRKYSRTNE